jgi:hypothetical protein
MADGSFVTAINCMDGRVQMPVFNYLAKTYGVDYVDMVTEPGPIKILAENSDAGLVASIRNRVTISAEKHGSRVLALVGHADCAGNPVDKQTQLQQLERSVETTRAWNLNLEIIKLWVDENWEVTQV